MDYPGKVITKTQVTPTQTSASGNWTLDDQAAAIKNNNWPVAGVPNPISKSLRFNSADSAYLNRTPASAGNQRTFTFSTWVKRCDTGANNCLLSANASASATALLRFKSDNLLRVYFYDFDSSSSYTLDTAAVFRDPSAWYHIVMSVDTTQATSSNRVILYVNNSLQTLSGSYPSLNMRTYINSTSEHNIGRGTYNSSDFVNGYLTETNFIDGQALTPSSFGMTNPQTGQWIPLKYSGTYGTNGFYLNFKDATSTTTLGYDYSGNANNWTTNNFSVGSTSSKVLEIVDATKSGSVTLSATVVGSGTVNLTAFGGCGNISGSVFTGIGSLNGLISDWQTHTVYKNGSSLFTVQGGAVNNNSGTQTATQSRTAQTVTQTGISVVSGDVISIAFGANNAVTAYYGYPNGAPSLTITASSGAFIADGSANDSLTDVPTPWFAYNTTGDVGGVIRGNYCTWSPLAKPAASSTSNGNLTAVTTTAADERIFSTIAVSSGKWYWEVTPTAISSGGCMVAVTSSAYEYKTANLASGDDGYGYYTTGNKYNPSTATSYGNTFTTNDVIGVALDMDNGKIYFSKNGTFQNSGNPVAGTNAAFTSISGTYSPSVSNGGATSSCTVEANFGQRPFAYTPPAGFRSLCTTNLPATTIGFGLTNQGDDYFNAVLYTGNGTSQTIDTGLQPDFIWIKRRNGAAAHTLTDSVRGTSKQLFTNLTDAEQTDADSGVTAIGSSSMTLGDNNLAVGSVNGSGSTYVAWNWKANGSGSSNTAGSITSTVSANTTAGFSIVTYTGNATSGATVGHGLGVAPNLIIVRNRTASAQNWQVYSSVLGATKRLFLDLTDTENTFSGAWNNTAPTSTVFSLGNATDVNGNTNNFVAYCFAAVAGYSAFGSYIGNGSADGPFIYTGFRPRFVMVKEATVSARDWIILDSARNTYNVADLQLMPNKSDAEATTVLSSTAYLDFVSNGFKVRNTSVRNNENTATYIYAAFAEYPFQFANAR